MKKKNFLFAVILAIVTCALPFQSFAGSTGWYAGAGFGRSTTDIDTSDLNDAQKEFQGLGFATSLSVDQTDTTKRVFGGYQVNKNFAVEGEYADFGKSTFSFSAKKGTKYANANGDFKTKGLGVSVVGGVPIGNILSVFAKAGVFRWNVKSDFNYADNVTPETGSDSTTANGIKPMVGVGVQINLDKTFAVRVEHERFKDVGKEDDTGRTDIRLTTANLVVKF